MVATMSVAPIAVPARRTTGEGRGLRVLVGIHDGTLSGVNTYVEQVAAAAATAVDDVTLLVADDELAADLGGRLQGIRVVSLGMGPITTAQRRRERLSPGYAARRLDTALAAARPRIGHGFDAAHLNHPHLAATVRPLAERVYVAAWYHPHSVLGRATGTWRQSGGGFPRRAGLAVKGVLHYRNDVRGYRAADIVVTPTEILAQQLRRRGFDAVQCTPPARALGEPRDDGAKGRGPGDPHRLLLCCGDLGHPRKNVGLALDAVAILSGEGRAVELELVGGNVGAIQDRLDHLSGAVAVTVRGRLPAVEVHRRMRAADALLFPSLFEEWGYVAAEAALQGTPVVTLPVYPFTEMLEQPYGFRASGLGAGAYAGAIADALRSGAPRSTVAEAAEGRFGLRGAGRRLAAIWAVDGPAGGRDRPG
jgi:glycosyltransferase involved in cell wall biosynthesis